MVRIMTDNAANLPKHLLEQYGIGELCLTYTIDGQPADINAEFDGRSFYEAMRHGAVVQTSMVTPDAARREGGPGNAPLKIINNRKRIDEKRRTGYTKVG